MKIYVSRNKEQNTLVGQNIVIEWTPYKNKREKKRDPLQDGETSLIEGWVQRGSEWQKIKSDGHRLGKPMLGNRSISAAEFFAAVKRLS